MMNTTNDDFYASIMSRGKEDIRVIMESDMHLHSTFSDGLNTPEEILGQAILKGYKEIAIVDHVRRTSDWVDKFAIEMVRLKHLCEGRIRLYSGIEAKVINLKGDIDARPEFFTKVDLVLGAFHRIPKRQDEYFSSDEISLDKDKALEYWFIGMMKLLENRYVHIIAHPTAILERYTIQIPYSMKSIIAQKIAYQGKTFEVNLKYPAPDEEFFQLLRLNKVKLSVGSDSHSIEEM